jgi:hypothetical protein
MLQTVSQLLPELPLILMTAVATHLVMSFSQTLMHYKLGHHPMGGKFFRNHINFPTRNTGMKKKGVIEFIALRHQVSTVTRHLMLASDPVRVAGTPRRP